MSREPEWRKAALEEEGRGTEAAKAPGQDGAWHREGAGRRPVRLQHRHPGAETGSLGGRGRGWMSCREVCRLREPWRTADRWCFLVTKWVLAASRCCSAALRHPHSCTKLKCRVPRRCLPSPRQPGRRPLCPHLRLRGAGQSAANHGMFPRALGGMLGDRGRRETQLKDRAGPSWGHGGSVGTVDTHSPRGWAQRMPALNMQKTQKWSGEGQLTVHKDRTGDKDLNTDL